MDMKKFLVLLFLGGVFAFYSCSKDDPSQRFIYLTTPIWESNELLVNGEDASGEGQLLEDFKGEAKFNANGSGYFGQYEGTWSFAKKETELVIYTPELGFNLTTTIVELTESSLKISTVFPNFMNPSESLQIEMSFVAK
jgi:hypothetical protein